MNFFTPSRLQHPGVSTFNPNPQVQAPDIPRTLDGVFDAYMRQKADARAAELQGLQVGQMKEAQAVQGAQQTAQFGAPLSSFTPQQMQAAGGAQPLAASGMGPLAGQGLDRLSRLREGLAKLGGRDPQTVQTQDLSRRKLESEVAENQGQAREKNALAALLENGGAGQPREETHSGVKYLVTTNLKGEKSYSPIPERQPGQNEFVARGYADGAELGNRNYEKLIAGGFDPSKLGNSLQSIPLIPNRVKDPQVRQYEQAKASFINSTLRRESGATIRDEEFIKAERQYFPQDGDDPATKAQKSEQRRAKIASLAAEGARVPTSLAAGGNDHSALLNKYGAP